MTSQRPTEPTAPSDDDARADEEALPLPVVSETAQATAPAEPPDPQTYLEIRPAEQPVDPQAVTQAMDLLHSRLQERTAAGLLERLRGATTHPTVEWLLVADGRADAHIRWLAGTELAALQSCLEDVLRTCLPDTYELRTVEWHPRTVEACLHGMDVDTYPSDFTAPTAREPFVAGVEYYGRAPRRRDWQTPLTSLADLLDEPAARQQADHDRRVPLAALVAAMRAADQPVLYQVVCQALDNWSAAADEYIMALENGTATPLGTLQETLVPRSQAERQAYDPPAQDRARIDGIQARSQHRSFLVSARAVVLAHTDRAAATRTAERLADALGQVSGPTHELQGRVVTDADEHWTGAAPGTRCYEALCDRQVHDRRYDSLAAWLPGQRPTSRGLVVGADELPGLWLLDGARLPPDGRRALAARPGERTAVPLPPPGQLARYRPPGMALCMPLTHDRQPLGQPVYLDPAQQDRHCIVVGGTGAGKSVLLERGVLTNTAASDGLDVLLDYKGGSTATDYLRAHYAEYGSLDDVLYFDCSRVLPALSFFDIDPLLEAGVPREEARSRKAGHYEEILAGLIGAERYGEATESVKAIRNHLRALYDPVHGDEGFAHRDLYDALQRTQRGEAMPSVSDEALASYFAGLQERNRDMFANIMAGAVGRVETIATDGRLAPLFNHQATAEAPQLAFDNLLDADRMIIFDFGGMEARIKRALTLVLLSALWTALKAREQRTGADASLPLVNLYLEEAGAIAATSLMDTLLAQGRSFGLSLTLGVQFPEQLSTPEPTADTYREALNETATFVVGNVAVDSELASVLATDEMPARAVDRRLSAMGRGEWLVRPGAAFGEATVRPFLAESLPAPPGHPASDDRLQGTAARAFSEAFDTVCTRSATEAGLPHDAPATTTAEPTGAQADTDAQADAATDQTDAETTRSFATRSLLPHTQRLPDCVTYDPAIEGLRCARCDNRYDASSDGLQRAIRCCHSLDAVDSDDIPVCDCQLKLTPAEIEARDWSLTQLLFLQAVYNAQQGRYEPPGYDIVTDSMLRLEEYVDLDREARQELLESDLIRKDTDRPHRLYSVSAAGRDCIGEAYRRGVEYGHGQGDLKESAEHACAVELSRRWLEQAYRQDPDSAVETVQPYYEPSEGTLPAAAFMGDGDAADDAAAGYERCRLDVAGLDAEGDVVVTVEVERLNHDVIQAVPNDFDKMAACEPEEAIWLVMSRTAAHEVLDVLNDPPDGEPRVEKTYSSNTPPQQFRIDTPGLTALYTFAYIQDMVLEET